MWKLRAKTSEPSASLTHFQRALEGDRRLVAVLRLEIGSAHLDDAISAALFNVALHASVGEARANDVLAAHVSLVNGHFEGNLLVVDDPPLAAHCDGAVAAARELFERVCPGVEFLPPPDEPAAEPGGEGEEN